MVVSDLPDILGMLLKNHVLALEKIKQSKNVLLSTMISKKDIEIVKKTIKPSQNFKKNLKSLDTSNQKQQDTLDQ